MPAPAITMTFTDTSPTDAFAAVHAAEKWLRDSGYSVGSMQHGSPRGILKGDFYISKWRNLTHAQRAKLDGKMIGGRDGPVTVEIWR